MKYIESFRLFESKDIDVVSIEQEAKDSLVYLLDGGEFDVKVSPYSNYLPYTSEILVNIEIQKFHSVSWQSIKDEVMPYLELVSDKYSIQSFLLDVGQDTSIDNNRYRYNLDELESVYEMIYSISFVIKK